MTTAVAERAETTRIAESVLGQWAYGNSWAGKFDPETSGYTDCSGYTKWVHGKRGRTLGNMSYDQAVEGIEVASGTTVAGFLAIAHLIKPADVTAMALESGYRGGIAINHVELNTGGVASLGHGSGVGPQRHNLTASWLLGDARRWTIRRFIPDDKTTTAASTPLTDLEKEIATMKATHVIFQKSGAIYIANILAGTYQKMKNPAHFSDRVRYLKRTGAKVVEWKHLRQGAGAGKSNVALNIDAFGVLVK